MSADNYIVIFREADRKYRGWMGFVSDELSDDEVRKGRPEFEADTLEDALVKAQDIGTEYGFSYCGDDAEQYVI